MPGLAPGAGGAAGQRPLKTWGEVIPALAL
jgi:hypothetical protein